MLIARMQSGHFSSLRIWPPLIRSRYYERHRVLHVVAGANERRLYSQATILDPPEFFVTGRN